MGKLIITLSGLTGSGKTTLGDAIGKKLGIKHISRTHKAYVDKIDVVEFTKHATPGFEKSFDKSIVEEAEKQDCVVSTWLGPWMIKNATIRVWLYADLDSRIKRKASELKVSVDAAKKYVGEKDKVNKVRFKKIYGIDIEDRSDFDLLMNTGKLTLEQCADTIIFLSSEKQKRRFT